MINAYIFWSRRNTVSTPGIQEIFELDSTVAAPDITTKMSDREDLKVNVKSK